MDSYKILLIKNNGTKKDITGMCGDLSWKDSIETLGMELNVVVARNHNDRYMKKHDVVEIGDKIVLFNKDKEIFRGIIIDLVTDYFNKSITAFDYAFYLNQSKTIIQFNKSAADKAIAKLCSNFNVPVGKITKISTPITKIYKDDTISDIIRDILEQATKANGVKYRLESRKGKIFVERYADLTIKPKFQPAENLDYIDVLKAIGGVSKTESIADMRNSILVSSDNEKSSKALATAKDNENIKKYGLLQDVESVDKKNKAQAKNIANNKLKELNRVGEDIDIGPLLGDDDVRSGRVLEIDNERYSLKGKYLVKECTHKCHASKHTMDLKIEKVV